MGRWFNIQWYWTDTLYIFLFSLSYFFLSRSHSLSLFGCLSVCLCLCWLSNCLSFFPPPPLTYPSTPKYTSKHQHNTQTLNTQTTHRDHNPPNPQRRDTTHHHSPSDGVNGVRNRRQTPPTQMNPVYLVIRWARCQVVLKGMRFIFSGVGVKSPWSLVGVQWRAEVL